MQDGRTLRLTARVWREGDQYVSQCVEVDVASYGDTPEEAIAMLREALELYFDDTTSVDDLHTDAFTAPVEVRLSA